VIDDQMDFYVTVTLLSPKLNYKTEELRNCLKF